MPSNTTEKQLTERDYDYLEHTIIGAVCNSEPAYTTISEWFSYRDFTNHLLADIFSAVSDLVASHGYVVVSPVCISDYMVSKWLGKKRYTKQIILDRLAECTKVKADILQLSSVAGLVKTNNRNKRIKEQMKKAIESDNFNFDNALSDVQNTIQDVEVSKHIDGILSVDSAFERWKVAATDDFGDAGIYTGWPSIDSGLKRPLARGEVISLAARAGVGKTHAATSITRKALIRNTEAGALFISLEMPMEEITERFLAQALNTDAENIRLEAVADNITFKEVIETDSCLDRIRLYDYDITIQQLPALIVRAKKSGINPRIVVIDYLGLIKWEGNKGALGYEKASEIARELKSVAKKTGVTILACAQLNRESGDGTTVPSLHHIRDSGAIEEASDRVFGLWKDNYNVFIKILKNRHGYTGAVAKLNYTPGHELVELPKAVHNPESTIKD